MSGVYLSLNQGWTYFKDKYGSKQGREKIKTVARAWKRILASSLNDFSYEAIDLKGKRGVGSLATGYELGHICGKFYSADAIPTEDIIIRDYNNLVGVYRELKGKMKSSILRLVRPFSLHHEKNTAMILMYVAIVLGERPLSLIATMIKSMSFL